MTDLHYIIRHAADYKHALAWAYWWRDNRRYFVPSRETWLEANECWDEYEKEKVGYGLRHTSRAAY